MLLRENSVLPFSGPLRCFKSFPSTLFQLSGRPNPPGQPAPGGRANHTQKLHTIHYASLFEHRSRRPRLGVAPQTWSCPFRIFIRTVRKKSPGLRHNAINSKPIFQACTMNGSRDPHLPAHHHVVCYVSPCLLDPERENPHPTFVLPPQSTP